MGAIRRLRFDCGVPPGIVMNDGIGSGQIERGAARLETDEE